MACQPATWVTGLHPWQVCKGQVMFRGEVASMHYTLPNIQDSSIGNQSCMDFLALMDTKLHL